MTTDHGTAGATRRTAAPGTASVVPTDEETARRAVEPYRDMTPAERLRAFEELLADMDAFLGDAPPVRSPDDEAFWRHWRDPSLGRPR